MMLTELQITNLRNICSARLSLHPSFNIIRGINGSGKTSWLEAIYLLATGHSFRTREIASLINYEHDSLTLFTKTGNNDRISLYKHLNKGTTAKINGESCLTSSNLARVLPCQILYHDIFNLIDSGPSIRRSMLDWGLFHVKHNYLVLWKEYRRALKQRNALLKTKAALNQTLPWNKILSALALKLNEERTNYFSQLQEKFKVILNRLCSIDCELLYYRGWDKKNEGKCLEDILYQSYERDLSRQYTHYGAHQADIIITSQDHKANSFLSRGQQKMILFALKFSQGELISQNCIYLIDDLAAELDDNHINKLFEYMKESDSQFFITIRPDFRLESFLSESYQLFEILKGIIKSPSLNA